MSGAESIALLKAANDAFNRGDFDAWDKLMDPAGALRIRGTATISGLHEGRAAILHVVNQVSEMTAGTMNVVPEVILADDDTVMVYARVTGSRPDGRRYDSPHVYLTRLRDGRVISQEQIAVDQQAHAEFFA